MSREDEDQFLEYARSIGNLLILPGTSPSSDFTPVDIFPEHSQDESTRRFWLHYTGAGMPLATEHLPERSVYVVAGFQSPVFVFLRSWIVSHGVRPGVRQASLAGFSEA